MNFDDLTFYRTPLQEMFLRMRINEHDSLRKVLRKNIIINNVIDKEINDRINGVIENFITMVIKGEQGTFKTSSALEFCKMIDKNFCVQRVNFTYDDFNNKIKNCEAGNCFELDEEIFQHGTGSVRIVQESQTLIETLRQNKNSMIIVCTTEKYFSEEIFTFFMETIDTCMLGTCKNPELHEIRSCEFCSAKDHLIKEVYVRLGVVKRGHFIGLYILPINWNNPLWVEYCGAKKEWLEIVKKQQFDKLDYEKIAFEILKLPESHLYRKKGQIKLLLEKNKPNLTKGEIDLLAEQIMIIRKGQEE
jgi:hypothetical protein